MLASRSTVSESTAAMRAEEDRLSRADMLATYGEAELRFVRDIGEITKRAVNARQRGGAGGGVPGDPEPPQRDPADARGAGPTRPRAAEHGPPGDDGQDPLRRGAGPCHPEQRRGRVLLPHQQPDRLRGDEPDRPLERGHQPRLHLQESAPGPGGQCGAVAGAPGPPADRHRPAEGRSREPARGRAARGPPRADQPRGGRAAARVDRRRRWRGLAERVVHRPPRDARQDVADGPERGCGHAPVRVHDHRERLDDDGRGAGARHPAERHLDAGGRDAVRGPGAGAAGQHAGAAQLPVGHERAHGRQRAPDHPADQPDLGRGPQPRRAGGRPAGRRRSRPRSPSTTT